MWYKGKRLLLTTLAAGLLYTTTAFAANVQMDLFYNGAHHAYNAKEIAIVIDGESYTDPNMPAVSIDGSCLCVASVRSLVVPSHGTKRQDRSMLSATPIQWYSRLTARQAIKTGKPLPWMWHP